LGDGFAASQAGESAGSVHPGRVPEKTRSLALRDAFEDWCIGRGYIQRNEIDPDLS
jgi:hypothetical protein